MSGDDRPPQWSDMLPWLAPTRPLPVVTHRAVVTLPGARPPHDHPVRPPAAPPTPEVLDRAVDAYRVMLPPAWPRFVRAVTLGLLEPGAAAAMDRERALAARVRARRTEPWVVAFVAGKGGVGTTTAAAGVALTLAAVRGDGTTLLDARPGTGSLGRRLAGRPAPTVAELVEGASGRPVARPLPVAGSLGVVDGPGPGYPIPPAMLLAALDGLRGQGAFTLADLGNDALLTGRAVLDLADHVVVVTAPSEDAVAATRLALDRVRQLRPRRLRSVVVAVACLTARQHRRTARRLRGPLGVAGDRVVAVPFDPALAAGGPLTLDRLRPATREAFLRVAGLLASDVDGAR